MYDSHLDRNLWLHISFSLFFIPLSFGILFAYTHKLANGYKFKDIGCMESLHAAQWMFVSIDFSRKLCITVMLAI